MEEGDKEKVVCHLLKGREETASTFYDSDQTFGKVKNETNF
jgi:hypothetical protein